MTPEERARDWRKKNYKWPQTGTEDELDMLLAAYGAECEKAGCEVESQEFEAWFDSGPYGNCDGYIHERMKAAFAAGEKRGMEYRLREVAEKASSPATCSECGVRLDNHRYHRFRHNGYAKCERCGTSWNAAIEICPKCGDVPLFPEAPPAAVEKAPPEGK